MGQPPPAAGEVVDAEILDERLVVARTSVSATAAEVVTALTEVAFREARTDEWIMGPPQPVIEPAAVPPDIVRRGPGLLDADSWDSDGVATQRRDSYLGRRRATSSARLWLVVSLVVAALSAAAALPFLLTSGASGPDAAGTPDGAIPSDIGGTASPAAAESSGQNGLPVIGAYPLVTTTNAAFQLTIQAEQGAPATSWGGPATKVTTNGVTVIDKIGDWPNTFQDGWLEFSNITVPATGSYVVTIFYLYTPQNASPSSGRRLWFKVNDGNTLTEEPVLPFQSTPTARKLYQNVTFQAGKANKIRFLNNSAQAPAIDRIEISKA